MAISFIPGALLWDQRSLAAEANCYDVWGCSSANVILSYVCCYCPRSNSNSTKALCARMQRPVQLQIAPDSPFADSGRSVPGSMASPSPGALHHQRCLWLHLPIVFPSNMECRVVGVVA